MITTEFREHFRQELTYIRQKHPLMDVSNETMDGVIIGVLMTTTVMGRKKEDKPQSFLQGAAERPRDEQILLCDFVLWDVKNESKP